MLAGLIAGSLVLTNTAVHAQAATNAPATAVHPPGPRGNADFLAKQLSLSDEQKDKVKAIMDDYRQQQMALRTDKSLSPADRRTKAKEIRESLAGKFKEVLTPEQFEKWQKIAMPHPRPVPHPATGTNQPAAAAAPAATSNQ